MQLRYCANDTCGNELGEDDIAFCSIDCMDEAKERKEADKEVKSYLDEPERVSPLGKQRREVRYCFWCGGDFTGSPTRFYCSAACKMAAWRGGIRVKKARSDRWAILDRDGFRCRYCGRTAREDGVKLHVDHVVPLSRGGDYSAENLVTACQECNLGKGARTPILPVP